MYNGGEEMDIFLGRNNCNYDITFEEKRQHLIILPKTTMLPEQPGIVALLWNTCDTALISKISKAQWSPEMRRSDHGSAL